MKVFVYLGHPAHYYLFKNVLSKLTSQGVEIVIACKHKDVLEELLLSSGYEYTNVYPKQRGRGKIGILVSMLEKDRNIFAIVRAVKPDVLIGTSVEITHVGRLLRIPSVVFNEDDYDVVPEFSWLAYPLATAIVAPQSCRMGRWNRKTTFYKGYHELAYLHPNVFRPDRSLASEYAGNDPYALIRLSALGAYHDVSVRGLTEKSCLELIAVLQSNVRVWISAEIELPDSLKSYQIKLPACRLHDVMAYASMYIGDSQTMACEAAVLGVPSFRINDFVRRIGYLDELEDVYQLTYGFKPADARRMIQAVRDTLNMPQRESIWQERRRRMLVEMVDVNAVMVNAIEQVVRQWK
ncbi:MAG TPA: DUF354 domain-containing protein [Bacteroidota bacterium]|nr:DUF354 domain-containing protein [Bacteroidota bacterium]